MAWIEINSAGFKLMLLFAMKKLSWICTFSALSRGDRCYAAGIDVVELNLSAVAGSQDGLYQL